jgi:hypothetical protein
MIPDKQCVQTCQKAFTYLSQVFLHEFTSYDTNETGCGGVGNGFHQHGFTGSCHREVGQVNQGGIHEKYLPGGP